MCLSSSGKGEMAVTPATGASTSALWEKIVEHEYTTLYLSSSIFNLPSSIFNLSLLPQNCSLSKFIDVCSHSKFIYVCLLSKFIDVCSLSFSLKPISCKWSIDPNSSDQVPSLCTAWRWSMWRGSRWRRSDETTAGVCTEMAVKWAANVERGAYGWSSMLAQCA